MAEKQTCRRITNNLGELACELLGLVAAAIFILPTLSVLSALSLIKLENVPQWFSSIIKVYFWFRLYLLIDRAMLAEELARGILKIAQK